MANLKHILISKQIINYLKRKKKGCNQNQITKYLQTKDYITIGGTQTVLSFLVKEGYLSKSLNSSKTYYLYFISDKKEFVYENYIDTKEFAESLYYCEGTINRRRKLGTIKDYIKLGKKYYINKNELENQRSL